MTKPTKHGYHKDSDPFPYALIIQGWERFSVLHGDPVACDGEDCQVLGVGGYYHQMKNRFLCPDCFEAGYPELEKQFRGVKERLY